MKHLLLSGAILAAALLFGLWTASRVTEISLQTAELLQQAQAQADKLEQARAWASKAADHWERNNTFLCVVLRHDRVDNVMQTLKKLAFCTEEDDFRTNCAGLLEELSHLAKSEQPLVWNIL